VVPFSKAVSARPISIGRFSHRKVDHGVSGETQLSMRLRYGLLQAQSSPL